MQGYSAGDRFDDLIDELIKKRGETPEHFLIHEMMVTALKLMDEKANRGELKIVNTALKELRYAFKVFSSYRDIRKVSVFGSARSKKSSLEYQMARSFGRKMVKKNFMIITGGASGVMEAANAGAGTEKSFGINIRLPFEQDPNPYVINDKKLINFKYFFTRKLIFIKESDAVVLFPGGFGTHDEGFEILTLIQTGKSQPRPVIMIDHPSGNYWKEWFRFVKRQLLDKKYISPEDMHFFRVTSDVDQAVEEIVTFYKNYQSSRFVGDAFVVRLRRTPPELLLRLNRDFGDVLRKKSRFETVKPFPEETYEGRDLDLPRIAFQFNKKSYGRIREMIDLINLY